MSRRLALALVAVMLMVVIGQAVLLREYPSQPVTEIQLHESRLVPFLQEIRGLSPDTYDSTLLNISRLRDGQVLAQDVEFEEVVVAEQLLARLTGQAVTAGASGAQPKAP